MFIAIRPLSLLLVCLWLLAGCAHHPGRMLGEEQSASELPMASWLPSGRPEQVVIGVHGLNDSRDTFAGIGPYLAQRGVAVISYDQRGFGATRERGYWPGTDALVADLRAIVWEVHRRYPRASIYLLGASMGGAVVITAAGRYPNLPVEGIILSAPAVWGGSSFSTWKRAGLWLGATLLPWLEVSRDDTVRVSRDPSLERRLRADPLSLRQTRLDTLEGVVGLMDAAVAIAPRVRQPVLVLYGLRDEVIPQRAIDGLLTRLQAPVDTELYPDGYHLLLRDRGAARVWARIDAWLQPPSPPVVATAPNAVTESQIR